MSRIRTIKPDFFKSPSITQCSLAARLTFQGLWCEADDEGLGKGDPRILKGAIWPLDDDITAIDVATYLKELENTGHIQLYEARGDVFYAILRWEFHQSSAYRRGSSKYPSPPADMSESVTLQDFARPVVQESAGREGNRKGIGRGTGTLAPDEFEVTPHLKEWATKNGYDSINLDTETQNFLDHHASKGSRFSDWNRAWQKWIRTADGWAKERKPKSAEGVGSGYVQPNQMSAEEVQATYAGMPVAEWPE